MNESRSVKQVKTMVGMAVFTALVVILQVLGANIRIGPFSPSLVLIPIVIGAAVYGVKAGAWLGLAFGIIVLIACIQGTDMGGWLMWSENPLMTAVICLGKGTAAGWLSGLVFRALQHRSRLLATVVAAVVCPVVNTGLFLLGAIAVFKPLLLQWAADWAAGTGNTDAPFIVYVIVGLVGLNFLVEMLINVILSPVVVRIIKVRSNG